MKSVTIIGANSYIARNLIQNVKNEALDIRLFLYDREDVHKDGCNDYAPVNISDESSVAGINFDVDAVILFAGKTGTYAGFDEPEIFVEVNELGLLNVLNAMRKAKSTAKLVFPSTRLVYKGKDEPLLENDTKEFKTIYSINKYACEQYLKMYSDVFDIRYCVFRICVPYGSLLEGVSSYGTAEFFIGKAMQGDNITLYGDGEVKRTLTYIGDICRTMLAGALSAGCMNDVYNIGGESYSLREMAFEVAKKYGVGLEYTQWPDKALKIESGSTVFDSGKLDSILGNLRKMTFKNWIGGGV